MNTVWLAHISSISDDCNYMPLLLWTLWLFEVASWSAVLISVSPWVPRSINQEPASLLPHIPPLLSWPHYITSMATPTPNVNRAKTWELSNAILNLIHHNLVVLHSSRLQWHSCCVKFSEKARNCLWLWRSQTRYDRNFRIWGYINVFY